MKRFSKAIYSKIQEWAFNKYSDILTQYCAVIVIEFLNHFFPFVENAFEKINAPEISQVIDALWWLDTAYFLISSWIKMFGKRPSGRSEF
jgi:hypothetical protein